MLGSQLVLDAPSGVEAVGTDLIDAPEGNPPVAEAGVDLSDEGSVRALFERLAPLSGVIHAAAYTAVDRAEEEEELARKVNGLVPEVVAEVCRDAGIPLVLVSTDFVFRGDNTVPYLETDPVDPLGAYGRTKLEGEQRAQTAYPEGVRIVRTQWLYGPRGKHFPGTMVKLARERESLKVVADQVGSPTSTLELSPALWDVWAKGEAGIYHASCQGACSWHEFAVASIDKARERETLAVREVNPCTTEEYPVPAPRPAYSVLSCDRLTALRGRPLAPWREALATFMDAEWEKNR